MIPATTLDTISDTTTPSPPAWPLAPTKQHHAHLTWAEWTAQQAAKFSSGRRLAPVAPQRAPSAQQSPAPITEHERGTMPTRLLVWPLAPTKMANAYLDSASWLDAQATGATPASPAHGASERAA